MTCSGHQQSCMRGSMKSPTLLKEQFVGGPLYFNDIPLLTDLLKMDLFYPCSTPLFVTLQRQNVRSSISEIQLGVRPPN